MHCQKCSKENVETDKFCSNCGAPSSNKPQIKKTAGFFKNNLFSNPVGWSKTFVGTKPRFYLMISVHLFAGVLLSLWTQGYSLSIIVFATVFPIYYLYALRGVLEKLEDKNI